MHPGLHEKAFEAEFRAWLLTESREGRLRKDAARLVRDVSDQFTHERLLRADP